MNINPVSSTSFESRFEKYHPYASGIQEAVTEAQKNVSDTRCSNTTEINEFANALDYLLHDGKDDVYTLEPNEDTNPYQRSDVKLYKNGECVCSLENPKAMDRERSYYNIVRKYVKDELKQDVSENKTEGLELHGDDYWKILRYARSISDKKLGMTKEGGERIMSSIYYAGNVIDKLSTIEVYEKLGRLSEEIKEKK